MQEIAEIVAKAKNGDMESMDYILQYFKPKVTAICRGYFLIGADFDDILQEGMIGLYKAIVGYNNDKNDSFSSFASMCIHHQIQNAVKVANSKKNKPLNDYVSINIEGRVSNNDEDKPKIILEATDKCAEQLSLDKENTNILYNKIREQLKDVQYEVLLMYLSGYSYTEIAKNLKLSNKNVDNNIQAIKRKLRNMLKGETA